MDTVSFRVLDEQAAAITGTFGHPIYSLDRCAYVTLGDFVPGERVRAADGWATVETLARWWGEQEVHSAEIDAEHRFLVGEVGVESRNAGPYTQHLAIYERKHRMSIQTSYLALGDDCRLIADALMSEYRNLYATDEVSESSSVEWERVVCGDRLAQIVEGSVKYLSWDAGISSARRHDRVSRGFPLDRHSTHLIDVSPAGEFQPGVARIGRLFLYSDCETIKKQFRKVIRRLHRQSKRIPSSDFIRAFPVAETRCVAFQNRPGGIMHIIEWK